MPETNHNLIVELATLNNEHDVNKIVSYIEKADFTDNNFAVGVAVTCLAIHNDELSEHVDRLRPFFEIASKAELSFKEKMQLGFMQESLGITKL